MKEYNEPERIGNGRTFYVVNALGQHHFFKGRKRDKAQALADEFYGKGKYAVRKYTWNS